MNDQRSTTEQLKDIYVLAVKAGHYDGANCILNIIGEGFVEQNPRANVGSTVEEGGADAGLKNGGWVSVKDRLPDDRIWILAFTRNQIQMLFYDSRDNWLCVEGDWPHAVTHWMPLPKSPVGNF